MNVPLHQQQNKCSTTLVKNKTAAAATALQFTYPLFTTNACSTSGNSSLAQAQVSVAQAPPKGGEDQPWALRDGAPTREDWKIPQPLILSAMLNVGLGL